jgi:hypothetical protein
LSTTVALLAAETTDKRLRKSVESSIFALNENLRRNTEIDERKSE